jgi:hypothetical protein
LYRLVDAERVTGARLAGRTLRARKSLDQAHRQWKGKIAGPNQTRDADGPVDAAPAIAAEIEPDKDIPWEKRGGADLALARVANLPQEEGRKYGEALKDEMPLCLLLGSGKSLHRVPSLLHVRHSCPPIISAEIKTQGNHPV